MIFDIQRFSTHDGPGIRTVIFFKGCPLSCAWCENPESQSFDRELLFIKARCVGCGSCLDPVNGGAMRKASEGEVEVDRKVRPPPSIAGACPSLALRLAGSEASVEEILAVVLKDEAFYRNSGGGVTFSGGEPFAQVELLDELVGASAGHGLDTAVETCLAVPWGAVERLIGRMGHWLVDLKHTDSDAFRAGTGGEVRLVLGNIERLALAGADIAFRVPLIPGFNDDEVSMRGIFVFASSLPFPSGTAGRRKLDILPYHDLARGKYEALGRPYPFMPGARVEAARIAALAELGRGMGLDITVGG
jgi:pyruvate formate lyase activating enzyme